MTRQGGGDLSITRGMLEVYSGELFGVSELCHRAAEAFASVKDFGTSMPTVLVVGEIYVRCDPFSNDFVIDKLERRGVKSRFAPFNEWIEYTDYCAHTRRAEGREHIPKHPLVAGLTSFVQNRIQTMIYGKIAEPLGWPERTSTATSLEAAAPYLREDLAGEAVLTIGGPTYEHAMGHIDGVVSVGPLECMPNKISEAQFFHVAEEQGLLSLSIPLNGDSIDPEILDNFAYEVKERHSRRVHKEERRRSWLEVVAKRSREVAQDAAFSLAAVAVKPLLKRRSTNGSRAGGSSS
jgi:hypothetical protein